MKGEWVSALTGLLYADDAAVLSPAVAALRKLAAGRLPSAR